MEKISVDELVLFLKLQVAELISTPIAEVDENVEFINFGIDSMHAIYLIEVLEKKLNTEINPLLFWEYPTIRNFAEIVISEMKSS